MMCCSANSESVSHQASVVFLEDKLMLPALLSDISRAENEIHCALYIFKTQDSGESSGLIARALADAATRGVSIHIVMDKGAKTDLSTQYNTFTGKQLEKSGIKVSYDSENRKLHAKMCVIDDISYIGSHNYTYSAMVKNKETTIKIKSKGIALDAKNYILSLVSEDI